MPRFKVGDKVKILESALKIGVEKESIGKTCIIIKCLDNYFITIKEIKNKKSHWSVNQDIYCQDKYWSVNKNTIEHIIPIGKQLIFSFMEQKICLR